MEERTGFVGIIVERRERSADVNRILSQYGDIIRGRIGIPDKNTGTAIIGLIVEGTNDQIGAMTGKIGNLSGITVKSALAAAKQAQI